MQFSEKVPDGTDKLGREPADRGGAATVRRRRFGRWVRWLLVTLLLLLMIGGVAFGVRHRLAVDRLAEATAEQDANHPGWRLDDIEAARADVPDDENGALIV